MSISSVDSEPLHIKPPVDLNLATEANRILYVLNKVIFRARFAGLLRTWVRNEGRHLKDILDMNDHFDVMQACERYCYLKPERKWSSNNKEENRLLTHKTSSLSKIISSREITRQIDDDDDDPDNKGDDDDDDDDDNDESSVGYDVDDESSRDDTLTKEGTDMFVTMQSLAKKMDIRMRGRHDPAIARALYILEENPEVQKLAVSMQKEITPQIRALIQCLTQFRNQMAVRLNENAAQYKTREKYMRETYEKNERAKEEIEKLEEALVVTKTDANVCLIGRNILINRHQKKIEKIKQNSLDAIEKRTKESEKAMANDWKASVMQQELLKHELQQASEKYSNLLRDHLATEKTLRNKRTKVENQVLGWIQKFDQDIGEKQAEEEEIQALLDQETNEVNEIQRQLDEQEEEYDELMQEKAAFEEEMLERRLYQFIVNRSARRIQRTYRLYKARKLAKKLAKKGKKGKKK